MSASVCDGGGGGGARGDKAQQPQQQQRQRGARAQQHRPAVEIYRPPPAGSGKRSMNTPPKGAATVTPPTASSAAAGARNRPNKPPQGQGHGNPPPQSQTNGEAKQTPPRVNGATSPQQQQQQHGNNNKHKIEAKQHQQQQQQQPQWHSNSHHQGQQQQQQQQQAGRGGEQSKPTRAAGTKQSNHINYNNNNNNNQTQSNNNSENSRSVNNSNSNRAVHNTTNGNMESGTGSGANVRTTPTHSDGDRTTPPGQRQQKHAPSQSQQQQQDGHAYMNGGTTEYTNSNRYRHANGPSRYGADSQYQGGPPIRRQKSAGYFSPASRQRSNGPPNGYTRRTPPTQYGGRPDGAACDGGDYLPAERPRASSLGRGAFYDPSRPENNRGGVVFNGPPPPPPPHAYYQAGLFGGGMPPPPPAAFAAAFGPFGRPAPNAFYAQQQQQQFGAGFVSNTVTKRHSASHGALNANGTAVAHGYDGRGEQYRRGSKTPPPPMFGQKIESLYKPSAAGGRGGKQSALLHNIQTAAKARAALGAKEIDEINETMKKLEMHKVDALANYVNGGLSERLLAPGAANALLEWCIEGEHTASQCKLAARAVALMMRPAAATMAVAGASAASAAAGGDSAPATFAKSVVVGAKRYFECRQRLRQQHFAYWLCYLNFLTDVYAALGFTYDGDLVEVLFRVFEYMLTGDVLDTLKIEELECLISSLMAIGYDLERQAPEKLAKLRDSIRDALVGAQEPWARKMILLLVELSAGGWKLPTQANEYYFQTSALSSN